MLQLSILLLATDRVAGEALTAALSKPGHGVTTVADPVDLFASAPGYGLVVVDQVPAPFTVAAVIEELRRDDATKDLPDPGGRPGRRPRGADRPARGRRRRRHHEAVRPGRARGPGRGAVAPLPAVEGAVGLVAVTAIGDPRGRRIVSVFSPKGGCGTTTIAVNLAMLAGERNPGGTLLIDLDLSFGQVSSHLNLQPKQSLLELARDDAALREPELFRTYTVQHPSGIQVLAAPPAPGFASLIDAEPRGARARAGARGVRHRHRRRRHHVGRADVRDLQPLGHRR